MVFSEIFYGSLIITVSGIILKITSLIFKLKCSECECLGFKIKRNVIMEEKEHEFDILNKCNTPTNGELP